MERLLDRNFTGQNVLEEAFGKVPQALHACMLSTAMCKQAQRTIGPNEAATFCSTTEIVLQMRLSTKYSLHAKLASLCARVPAVTKESVQTDTHHELSVALTLGPYLTVLSVNFTLHYLLKCKKFA